MSKSERNKGATYEREVANYLKETLGVNVRRKLGQARDSGNDIDLGKFRLELKRRKQLSVYSFMEQVEQCVEPGQVPAVVMRADGKKSLVLLRLEDAVKLMGNELER